MSKSMGIMGRVRGLWYVMKSQHFKWACHVQSA